MIEDVCCLKIDQAGYMTLTTALKALNPDINQRITSLHSLVSSVDTSIKGAFHKPGDDDIFVGVFISDLWYDHSKSVRLTLEEVAKDGTRGPRFLLTIYGLNAEEWFRNTLLKILKDGKMLVLFQRIPFQVKTNEVHFHLTTAKKFSSNIWIKSFDFVLRDTGEKYGYKTLAEAADEMANRCNLYAVVHSILKEPASVKKGRAHGMILLVDQSCYEDNVKKREFATHIFTSSLERFPKINKGDVVRLHRANTEARPGDGRPDFRVFREEDIVVFPWDDHEDPRFLGTRFTFSEEDVAKIQNLKKWSLDRFRPVGKSPQPSANEPKIVTISQIKVNELFNLPCRLVEFFDEGQGVALWVEDGTKCPLYTCSDATIQPFDSQATQDVCNECAHICVRCSKPLVSDVELEKGMLLYLRQVEPTGQVCELDELAVVQFEIKGGVEKLPLFTRYHKSLMLRLDKKNVPEPNQQPADTVQNVETTEAEPVEEEPQKQRHQETAGPSVADAKPTERPKRSLISSDSEVVDSPPENNQRKVKVMIHRSAKPEAQQETEAASPQLAAPKVFKVPKPIQDTEPSSPRRPARERRTDHLETIQEGPRVPFEELPKEAGQVERAPVAEAESLERDNIPSSGDSTERAMKEMDLPEENPIAQRRKLLGLSPERVLQEARRLSLLLGDDDDDAEIPATQFVRPPQLSSQNIAPLEEATFSQVFASTQKVVRRSVSPEIPNAQQIFNQSSKEDSFEGERDVIPGTQGLDINTPSSTPSPNPVFKVANEFLEVKTLSGTEVAERNDENQQIFDQPQRAQKRKTKNKRIDYESFDSNDELDNNDEPFESQKRVVIKEDVELSRQDNSVETRARVRCIVRRSERLGQTKAHSSPSRPLAGILKSKSAYAKASQVVPDFDRSRKREASPELPPPAKKNRTVRSSCSSNDSIELLTDDKRESDVESIIMLDPASQFDMEKLYQEVESAALKSNVIECLEDVDSVMPGEHFRIKTRIRSIRPKNQSDKASLENLLVGVCPECQHVWEYKSFKNSVSERARRTRLPLKQHQPEDDDEFHGVINYLCSELEHETSMRLLAEAKHPDIRSYDYDENISMDRSFAFVCPMCLSHGVPDTLCQLRPSFFFWIHLTQRLENNWSGCLHVMASGIHAEFFLGTKADHVLRSSAVWEKAEARIAQLAEREEPIVLVVCQSPDTLDEFYLEHTYNVFSEKHVLPWFAS